MLFRPPIFSACVVTFVSGSILNLCKSNYQKGHFSKSGCATPILFLNLSSGHHEVVVYVETLTGVFTPLRHVLNLFEATYMAITEANDLYWS